MAAFYVGQRVKKVRGKQNVGMTGTVVGHIVNAEFPENTIEVRMDGDWLNYLGQPLPGGIVSRANPNHFEPITDTPLAADILTMERLPEWNCPLPEVAR